MVIYEDIGFRPVERRDLEEIRLLRNDQSTAKQLTDPRLISEAQQEEWFKARAGAYFTVVRIERDPSYPITSEKEFVGIIRTSDNDPVNRSICIGADVAVHMRGKGYGTKIYKAILKYLFDDLALHRVWLLVLETNDVGRRLYSNVGFTEEGRMRNAIWRDGGWRDYVMMSILRSEYRSRFSLEGARKGYEEWGQK